MTFALTSPQRIEPYGWDAQDRTYFVLDDNRVYRFSEPPAVVVSKAKPKPKKTFGSSRRLSKRRRAVSDVVEERLTNDDNDDENNTHGSDSGGVQWECVAVTLEDVRLLINSMRKTRDGNEKVLRDQLEVHLLPILERQDESRKRKQEKHEREMLNLAKMASAKRSSRIAHKIEQQKQDEKDREENERLLLEGEEERRAEQKRLKLERERDFRMFSREKRLKERDYRRQLHQKELNQLSEDNKFGPDGTARVSERRVQLEIERNKQVLKELEDEDEDWTFDCICGLYGQVDDGAHSIACERCNVWQHSKCVNVDEAEADRPDFQFFCTTCRRRIEEENTPRKTIKLKIKGPSEVAATKQRVAQLSNAATDQSLSPISPNDAAKHESQRAPTQGAEIASPLSSHAATGPFTGKQESSQAGTLARSHEEMAPEGGDPSQLRADILAAVPTMRAASFSKESDLGHGSIRSATVLKSDILHAAEKQQDGHTVNVATTPLHSKAGVDMPEPSGAGTTQPSRTTTPQSSSHQPQDSISGTNYSSATLQPRSAPFGFRQLPPLQPRSACQSDKTPTDLPSQPVTTVTLPPISSFSNPSMDRPVALLEPREQNGERALHSGDGSPQQ